VHLLSAAMRESGKATDRLGMTISGNEAIRSEIARHRPTMNLSDKLPVLAADAFVAPNASVIGEVLMLDQTSVHKKQQHPNPTRLCLLSYENKI